MVCSLCTLEEEKPGKAVMSTTYGKTKFVEHRTQCFGICGDF